MAFLAQDPNQDPNQQQNTASTTPGAPGQGTGELGGSAPTLSSSGAGTLGGASGTSPSPKGTSSGSFTNLQNYVNANAGNDAQLGKAVENTVAGKAQAADTAGQSFQTAGQQAADAGSVREDPSLLNSLNSAGSGTGTLGGYDPNAFNSQYNATYNGPTDATKVSGYGDTNLAYQNVQTEAQNAASTDMGKRGAVLKDTFGTGGRQYNQGENSLDSFLLGAGSGGQAAQQDIASKYGNYANNLQNWVNGVNSTISGDQAATAKTQNDTRAAASNAFGNVQGRLDTAANQASSANTSDTAKYQALASGDPAALKAAGYSDAAIKYLQSQKGVNYGNYVTQNTGRNVGDFANTNDASNYSNLLNLINGAGGSAAAKYSAADLTPAGGAGPQVNQADVTGANNLAALENTIGQNLAAANASRNADYQNAVAALTFGANGGANSVAELNKLGITPDQLTFAKQMGVNPLSFLKQNPAETTGQVATAGQKMQLNNLAQLLGLSPDEAAIAPAAAAANPYTFDTSGWQTAYNNALATNGKALPTSPAIQAGQVAITANPQTSGNFILPPSDPNQPQIVNVPNLNAYTSTTGIDPLEYYTLNNNSGRGLGAGDYLNFGLSAAKGANSQQPTD